MFKFVVVCALIGAAVAEPEPGVLFGSYAYPGGIVASAPSYIPSAYSNLVYNSPLVQPAALTYSAPLAHLIKKRSVLVAPPALTTYATGAYATAYPAIAPLATSYAAAIPTTYSSPLLTTAHLIKKRSAPLIVPSAYSAISPLATSYATGPLYTSNIGATSYISSPYISSSPLLAYGAPLIKK